MLLSPGDRAGRKRLSSSASSASLGIPSNLGLAVTAGSSALTITMTDGSGNTPTADSPVKFSTQNSVEIVGTVVEVEVTSETTLIVPSGATLGVPAAEGFRLWVLGTDGGNLAVTNRAPDAFKVYGLSEFGMVPTDAAAIGTGSDSAKIIYATADESGNAYRILGMIEFDENGIVTPGTWADTGGVPDNMLRIALFSPGMPTPGHVIQTEGNIVTAFSRVTGSFPFDDTKPQDTEGGAHTTQTLTPTSAANILEITAQLSGGSTPSKYCLALFSGASSDALANSMHRTKENLHITVTDTRHRMRAPDGSSEITFESRIGPVSGTTDINGYSNARKLGGAITGWLQTKEIMT